MNTPNKAFFILVSVFIVLGFAILGPTKQADASSSCKNGFTMSPSELYDAVHDQDITFSYTTQNGQLTLNINNTTGCTAPAVLASYKMFKYPGVPGWLTDQEYIASSQVVNINPYGNTSISVAVAECRTQVDAWYQQAPHQLYDGVDYTIPGNSSGYYTFAYVGTYTPLCVAAPVCTPSWNCTSWSSCVNGQQTRTCTDSNNCGVTTGKPSETQACSYPAVSVSCYATPSQINQNQSASFIATASGGNGSYAYSWTGACSGTNQTCSNTFSQAGTQTATVTATSSGQTNNASCSVVVSQANIACSSNSQCGPSGYTGSQYCQNNSVYQNYITYTCNNPNTPQSYCSNAVSAQLKNTCTANQTCSNGLCNDLPAPVPAPIPAPVQTQTQTQTQTQVNTQTVYVNASPNTNTGNTGSNNTCSYHAYQRCSGSNLYWYDSCGNQQESQYCLNGCYNNACQNYANYNNNCTYHAYKLCVGNNSYWFDSCGNQQDLFQSCYGANMICSYGQCSYYQPIPAPVPPPSPNPYIAHYSTKCYNNNIYWYDSLGVLSDLFKNCADNNSCTIDSCSNKTCSNVLKCDGSTCASGGADYNKYCQNTGTASPLSVTFLVKPSASAAQWQKSIELGQNSTAYFSISVTNNSDSEISNANISANIPGQITTLGNLQINGVSVSGDINTGIAVGYLSSGTTKTIKFEGKTQTFSAQATAQANSIVNVNGTIQSDELSINFNPSYATASVSSPKNSAGIWEFLKRWYLWILVGLVLVFLFVVVFRRLSSNA
ncbi:MAG: hypothetical protein A2599_03510 [Candidatus Staskawiczbacteria bacterium RIFOXYD1_FULL_39_28]|nr:MAG: hypothetical protein A2599_03510 [Candidatus Staskawiczbacteria bacterium RIFOXYD1_FULL_39_28]